MGDRTHSQFYCHLQNLATSDVSESMVLSLWKRRLPSSTQHVLAALVNVDADTLVTVADRVHELPQPPGQVAAATPARTATTYGQQNLSGDTRHDRLADQVEVLLRAWSLGEGRQPGRRFPDHRRRRPPSRRRRSKSRENVLCFYPARFGERSTRCQQPCSRWNAGNASSRPETRRATTAPDPAAFSSRTGLRGSPSSWTRVPTYVCTCAANYAGPRTKTLTNCSRPTARA
jgi:hypothetical protein